MSTTDNIDPTHPEVAQYLKDEQRMRATQPPTPSQEAREAANNIACKLVGNTDISLDEARQLLAPLIQQSIDKATEGLWAQVEDYKRAYNECWAGSPAVKAELESLRSKLTALQLWSERAREAMVKALNQLDDELLTDENLWDCMKRVRSVLSSFPAEDAKEGRK